LTHSERTRGEIRRDYAALAHDHANRADRVIVVSRFTSAEVQRQLGVPSDRISICPPGAPEWTPRSTPPAHGYVLFFGTLEPRKNVGGLLDAYERLVTTRPASSPLPELVLAGKATDALEQPSFDEGFGIPVLEAMTAGVPVVASNRGALPEVVGDTGLIVDPEDADAMAAAITRMIDDEPLAAASAAKGVLRSREFNWAETARRVIDAYQQAVECRA
jgi:glycosyltransferase involved in cell wall biosynthesis